MAGLEIRIKQNTAFMKQIGKFRYFITRQAKEQIAAESFSPLLNQVIRQLQEYPPETEANRPPPPYYIRGIGKQITYSTNLKNSQQMGERWTSEIRFTRGTPTATIKNSATYSPYVQLRETQAWFHAAHYWPTVEDILEKTQPQLEDKLKTVILNYLKE